MQVLNQRINSHACQGHRQVPKVAKHCLISHGVLQEVKYCSCWNNVSLSNICPALKCVQLDFSAYLNSIFELANIHYINQPSLHTACAEEVRDKKTKEGSFVLVTPEWQWALIMCPAHASSYLVLTRPHFKADVTTLIRTLKTKAWEYYITCSNLWSGNIWVNVPRHEFFYSKARFLTTLHPVFIVSLHLLALNLT